MWLQDRKRGAVALVCATALSSLTLAGTATAPAAAAEGEVAGAFSAVAPSRVLDTREGLGAPAVAVPGGGSVTVTIGGEAGVPTDAAAVVLNVTVTRTSAAGHITAYPTGSPVPTASNLNFVAGQTLANAVTVKLGTGGRVTLVNGSTRPVHLVADVAGWYAGGTPSEAGTFTAVAPQRLLDTRSGLGAPRVQVPGHDSVTFDVGGRAGVPDDAVAAVLNVTVTRGTSAGHVTAYPAGYAPPLASNLNFVAGQTVANAVTVQLGDDGEVTLENGSANPVDLVVDVAGWFLPGDATVGGAFVPVEPTRLLDTRNDEFWYDPYADDFAEGPLPGGGEVWLDPQGALGVNYGEVGTAVLSVTATRGTAPGHVTAYDGDLDVPLVSTLNFAAGRTVPNQATVSLGEYQQVGLVNGSEGSVDLVVDISGFYLAPPPEDVPGATLVSANDAGEVGDDMSYRAFDVSPDGRFVLFESASTNLAELPESSVGDSLTYLRDTVAGTTTLVTPTVDGTSFTGFVLDAEVSDDGRTVAFLADGANLVPGDTNRRVDVFVRDVPAGTTTRIVGNTGRQLDDWAVGLSLSADGATVAFATASSRVASPQGASTNVFTWDRATQRSTWVDPGEEDAFESSPALSADGRYLAFTASGALVAEDLDDSDDLYVRDLETGSTTLVSESVDGGAADGGVTEVAISADGSRVVWTSDATDLVADDPHAGDDVFARDWREGTDTVLVSDQPLELDDWTVATPRIDADGSHVVYSIEGSYLEEVDGELVEAYTSTVVLQEVGGPALDLGAAWEANVSGFETQLTGDASRVLYVDDNPLVAADTNWGPDVYLRDVPSGDVSGAALQASPRLARPERWAPVQTSGS